MSLFESLVSYFEQEMGLLISGVLIGSVLGCVYGYTQNSTRKQNIIIAFVFIIIAISGDLYIYSLTNQLHIFTSFTITLSLGFIIIALITKRIHSKRYDTPIRPLFFEPDSQLDDLCQQFGPGFTHDDKWIIEAIVKGKKSYKEIAIYSDLEEKLVKNRIKFMKKKGVPIVLS